MKISKLQLVISLVSLVILLAIFLVLLIQTKRQDESYFQNRNRNRRQIEQTTAGLLLYDLKTYLDKNDLKVQMTDFKINDLNYTGYKLILITPNKNEIEESINFLTNNDFEIIETKESNYILKKSESYCKTELEENNNFSIYCGIIS